MDETQVASQDYDVVLLVEGALDAGDAARVRSLHEGLDEPVTYHVLMPVEDAAERIQATLGGLSTGEMITPMPPTPLVDAETLDAVRDEVRSAADEALATTLSVLQAAGATATGTIVGDEPVAALAAKIAEVDGREAIVVTRPHVVAEFFHVDWSAQARRKLGVPVLHLVEHESFDEQAGEGEGASLI